MAGDLSVITDHHVSEPTRAEECQRQPACILVSALILAYVRTQTACVAQRSALMVDRPIAAMAQQRQAHQRHIYLLLVHVSQTLRALLTRVLYPPSE